MELKIFLISSSLTVKLRVVRGVELLLKELERIEEAIGEELVGSVVKSAEGNGAGVFVCLVASGR